VICCSQQWVVDTAEREGRGGGGRRNVGGVNIIPSLPTKGTNDRQNEMVEPSTTTHNTHHHRCRLIAKSKAPQTKHTTATAMSSINEDWSSSSDDEDSDSDDEMNDEDRFTFHSICSFTQPTPPTFDTLASALEYDASNCGFHLLNYLLPSTNEDFYEGAIILVNKCRAHLKEKNGDGSLGGDELGKLLIEYLTGQNGGAVDMGEEENVKYFKPVLEDDAVLMCIDELQELKSQQEASQVGSSDVDRNGGTAKDATDASPDSVKEMQSKIAMLEEQLSRAKACISSLAIDDGDESMADASCSDDDSKKKRQNKSKSSKSKYRDNDTYYFSSYSNTGIHETMLRDTVRTSAYESAILSNADSLFRGKTVLDIGCGTGVLSLFCAKAGAKKVIAVDNSDILLQAQRIVDLNGFGDVVTCVRGKIETLIETNALPLDNGETADIIVSEWMGYGLFFETMLPSVMVARDAIMTPNTGNMFPNVAKIFIEGGNEKDRLEYWDNVHGLNMAPMKARMVDELVGEALVEIVDDEKIITERVEIVEFDLNTCKDEDLDFEVPFKLSLRGDLSKEEAVEVHHLVVSFDIDFSVPNSNKVSFSTGCQSTPTHWKQAVMWFDPMHNCPTLNKQNGDLMKGMFRMKRNAENHRAIDMAVSWETGRFDGDSWERRQDGVLKRSLIA
jgi:predicted RNA methylase